MTDILSTIKQRRSIRSYKEGDIEKEKLDVLLEAIRWSPSWANTQCWEVVLVNDPDTKRAIQ